MRVTSRFFDWIGGAALVFALLLASPGVDLGHAEGAPPEGEVDFSWDPALEPDVAGQSALARSVRVSPPAGTCAATGAPTVLPTMRTFRAQQGMPLLIADGEEPLNSLNSRGYNIGKPEPSQELQALMAEIRRR